MVELVGFFSELDTANPDVYRDSIVENLDMMSVGERELVASYLRNGVPLVDITEAVPDVVAKSGVAPGGSSLLTDGVWVWREDLRYYVNHYGIGLKPEFLAHVAAGPYGVPAVPASRIEEIIDELIPAVVHMKRVPHATHAISA